METNHKFWVDLEIVMLSCLQVSQRPTWSIFILNRNPQNIFESNQSHCKANSIIYNFCVYTKDQFKTEMGEKARTTREPKFCPHARLASEHTRF